MKTVKNSTAMLLTLLALMGASTLSSCSEQDETIKPQVSKEVLATGDGSDTDPPCNCDN